VIKKNVIALKDKPTIEFMKGIALKAGKILDAMYGKVDIEYTKENIADVVTKADLASNKLIVDSISKQFPDHTILSEEGDHKITDGHLWIIDPLDGTRNYSTKMPIYGLMIAYAYNKEVEMCVIYLPYFDELYYAQKDKGAFMNDKRIRCSETKNVEHSYGVSGGIFGSENRLIFDGNVTAFAKEKSRFCLRLREWILCFIIEKRLVHHMGFENMGPCFSCAANEGIRMHNYRYIRKTMEHRQIIHCCCKSYFTS
jgi:fructose-1,6-bisphosphatase/inositol monophosphatase family enzyme